MAEVQLFNMVYARVHNEFPARRRDSRAGNDVVAHMTVSPIGRAWTAHSEGCRLTAYPDNGACSIGYGHRGVPVGATCTQAEAEAWLEADLSHACEVIADAVKVDLTQGQIDALADFIFNEGEGHFKESTLLRVLNFAEYARVPDELRRWVYAAGVVKDGLRARREGEVVLWNGGNPLEVLST